MRSALDKNLNAKAISTKPKVTFTSSIQLPDFGNDFNQVGNNANSPKGNANAVAKPNIPTVGPAEIPPELVAVCTKSVPIIGPVQLNETRARVNAMKKMPVKPRRFEAWSALFAQLDGIVISK